MFGDASDAILFAEDFTVDIESGALNVTCHNAFSMFIAAGSDDHADGSFFANRFSRALLFPGSDARRCAVCPAAVLHISQ